jgi:hypothetical protein
MPSRDTYQPENQDLFALYDGIHVVEDDGGEDGTFGVRDRPEDKFTTISQQQTITQRPRFSLRPSHQFGSMRFIRENTSRDVSTVSEISAAESKLRELGRDPMDIDVATYRPVEQIANTKRKRVIDDNEEASRDEDGQRIQDDIASRRTKRQLTTHPIQYTPGPALDKPLSPITHWPVVDQNTFRIPPPDAEDAVRIDTFPSSNQLTPPISPHHSSFSSSGLSEVDLPPTPDTPMGSPWTGDTEPSQLTPELLSEALSSIASQSPSKMEDKYQAPWSSAYRRADGLGAEWTFGEAPKMTLERSQFQDLRARVDTVSDGSSRASAVSDGEKYLYDDTCWERDSLLVGIERGMDLLGVTENHHLTDAEDQSGKGTRSGSRTAWTETG